MSMTAGRDVIERQPADGMMFGSSIKLATQGRRQVRARSRRPGAERLGSGRRELPPVPPDPADLTQVTPGAYIGDRSVADTSDQK